MVLNLNKCALLTINKRDTTMVIISSSLCWNTKILLLEISASSQNILMRYITTAALRFMITNFVFSIAERNSEQFTIFARNEYPSVANNYKIFLYEQRLHCIEDELSLQLCSCIIKNPN